MGDFGHPRRASGAQLHPRLPLRAHDREHDARDAPGRVPSRGEPADELLRHAQCGRFEQPHFVGHHRICMLGKKA